MIATLLYLQPNILALKNLLSVLKIAVPEKIYIKDPETSELGRKIIEHSIYLIEEIGFESFTFKKLGLKIGSNESSIYRYFESKHKLLLYLTSWYWAWLEYQLVIETFSISDAKEKLEKAISVVTRKVEEDTNFSHVNEILLYKIIVNESSKSFLTKNVQEENKNGYFEIYKRLISRISEMILNIKPSYLYSMSLASIIVEGSLHQHFLCEHFPSLTSYSKNSTPSDFFSDVVFKALEYTNE